MYETSFGFTRPPFTDPDAADFQPFGAQAAVLAELREALEAGAALIVLSGPVGTGKTTLLRRELGLPDPRRHAVLFWNAHVGFDDLLNYLGDDLGLRAPGTSRTERIKALRTALVRGLAEGWTLLIAVDDAQNLPAETLAGLHALLDLREVGRGLVQVLLCGQPELQQQLAHDPKLTEHPPRRLNLRTLDAAESAAFIAARLAAAGRPGAELFDAEALVRIHELAHGVPRLLNRICNQSLLLAYLGSERRVTAALVRDVAADTPPTEAPPQPRGPLYEPMSARPAIAAESVPHIRTPELLHHAAGAPDPATGSAARAAALSPLHADPVALGHRPLRARSQLWLGLAAILAGVALAGFAAWRNGWLPLPASQPVAHPAAPAAPVAGPATPSAPPPAAAPAGAGTPAADAAAPPPPDSAPAPAATVTAPDPGATAMTPAASAPSTAAPPAEAATTPGERDGAAGSSAAAQPPAAAEAGTEAPPAAAVPPVAAGAATPAAAALPGATADDAVASAVRALLAEARAQYAGLRYTQPPGDNALQTWRQVLTLAPGNAEALAGLANLRARFVGWGRQAQARGEYERALRHYEIARSIDEDAELLGLIAESRRRRDAH